VSFGASPASPPVSERQQQQQQQQQQQPYLNSALFLTQVAQEKTGTRDSKGLTGITLKL